MRTYIEITGYVPPDDSDATLPDHLGLQLDLAGHIAEQFPKFSQESPEFETLIDLRQAYFATHLLWPSDFLQAVKSRGDSTFYTAVASLTESFLQNESESLPEP